MQWLTVEQIGPTRSLTPEGFLICEAVPIARTGLQLYGPGETPIQIGNADIVRIERDEEEVFRPQTIASVNGKPVVNEHPINKDGLRTDITPRNWRDLAIGTAMNARRGEGEMDSFLIADLVIADQDAIDLIESGKREISVGYDADYEELDPGHGRQKNIIANHIALVDQGRCGPRCSIGDAADDSCETSCEEEIDMATGTWADRLRKFVAPKDYKAFDQELQNLGTASPTGADNEEEEGNGGNGTEHHVHVHIPPPGSGNGNGTEAKPNGEAAPDAGADPGEQFTAAVKGIHQEMDEMWDAIGSVAGGAGMADAWPHRDSRRGRDQDKEDKDDKDTEDARNRDQEGNKKILPGFEMEVPPGATDSLRRAHDSALLEDSFSQTIALAEILVPGIRLPTFDRAARPRKTFDALCAFRGKVLDLAYAQPDGRDLIDEVTGSRFTSARAMTCERVRDVFFSVGALKKRLNNSGGGTVDQQLQFGGTAPPSGPIQTLADLQKSLDAHYAAAKH